MPSSTVAMTAEHNAASSAGSAGVPAGAGGTPCPVGAPSPGGSAFRPGFTEVGSAAELREILGEPHPIVIDKVHTRLDEDDLGVLARSAFCLTATSDAHGSCDVSPRGDLPGFTHVVDPGTLALPERRGNRRGDSLHNILGNPHAGLLYLVPGSQDVLRINGRARVLTDAAFFDAMASRGRRPDLAVLIEIDEVYRHCAASLNRSGLWDTTTWASV
ncbi:MSMEG_1061 family FMN-dependent PPOX-type flavoprotein [Streptomyces uncialis]|uniref:MSMEG_1061 family FMN-dependent PPOX-type flavoprotein n=1 Tax=Streptomyces uncialis TaxID=1048205 RepID=UPI0033D449B2